MRLIRLMFLAAAALLPTLASTQEAPPPAQPTAQPPAQQPAAPAPPSMRSIEEIIITAERREQNLQDVAQSISAFTPADLESANIQDAYDLQLKVPGLVATGGLPAITLRGLGQDADVLGPGIDPGFQLHINDIYVAQLAVALLGFVDLGTIEVLPGPQGTGFGRNSTGGSMNMQTQRPDLEEWEFSGDFDYSRWNNARLTMVLNAPLYETVAARLAYRREFPSNIYEVSGRNGHSQRLTNNALSGGHFVRSSIRWVPNEDVTTDFILSYSVDKDDGGTPRPLGDFPALNPGQTTIYFGGVDPTGATPNPEDPTDLTSNRRQWQQYETFWAQAIVEWSVADHVVKLNGNYQYWDYGIDRDQDFTDNDAQRLQLFSTNKTWSAEATVRSDYDNRWNWVFGSNYQRDRAPDTDVPVWNYGANTQLANFAVFDLFANPLTEGPFSPYTAAAQLVCDGPCIFQPGDDDRPFIRFQSDTTTETVGVFFDGGVDLTEQFHLQAGVRYSWTSRDMNDFGHLDILVEPYDVVTDGFCPAVLGVPSLGPFDLNPKENCFEILVAPGILQPYLPPGSPTLNASNVAFLAPWRGNLNQFTSNAVPVVKEKTWDSVTGRVRFEWRPIEDQLFYVGYSRGERHGGFNFFSVDPFKSEKINAVEVGAKNSLLDGRLILNSTFFYYDFKNRFITETENNVTTTINVPESVIYGLELQWIWAPTDALQLSGNAGWLHTEITSDFFSQDNTTSVGNPNGFCPTKVYPNTPGSLFAGLPAVGDWHGVGPTCDGAIPQNLKGNVLPRAPEFSVSASAQYAFEMDAGTLTPRVDFAYRDDVNYRQFENPLDRQPAYTRTDARIRYDLASKPLWFEAYIQNLEDNGKIRTQVETQLNWKRYYWLAAPRTFGVRLGWQFGGASAGDLWPF